MIVVAIAGVLMALAVSGWRRAAVKRDIHSAASDIESAIRTARNIAGIVGGSVGMPNFTNCAVISGGGAAPQGDPSHVSIRIDGPARMLVAPARIRDDGGGNISTECVTIDLSTFNSDGLAAELLAGTDPALAFSLSFSQMGRPYTPPGAPLVPANRWNVGVRTVGAETGLEDGLQILPSGVMCRRKIRGLAAGSPIRCDQN